MLLKVVAGTVLMLVVLVADAAEALWTTISLTPVCSRLTTFTFPYLLQSATAVPADHLVCSLTGGAPDWTGEPLGAWVLVFFCMYSEWACL